MSPTLIFKRARHWLFLAALAAASAGCMSLSGYDGNKQFACAAPDGVLCSSMTGVYENAKQQNLPAQQVRRDAKGTSSTPVEIPAPFGTHTKGSTPPAARAPLALPMRTAATVQRIWIAPWTDAEGDLHEAAFLYVVTDPGDWAIDHHKRALRTALTPTLRAPVSSLSTAASEERTAASTRAHPSAASGARAVDSPNAGTSDSAAAPAALLDRILPFTPPRSAE